MREIKRALAPVKRRMRAQRAIVWGAWGALAAGACIVGLRIVSFARMFETMWIWAACAAAGMTGAAALAGAAWPVTELAAAKRADSLGLMARAQTAVALEGEESSMAQMQREDALASLRALEPRRAMKLFVPKIAWIGVLACAAAVGLSFLIPNPQDARIRERNEFRAEMAAQADRIEKGAEALDAEKPDAPETKRLLGELSQALRRAEDTRDALEAVDQAERRLLAMQQRTAGDALNALNGTGMDALAQALGNEDRQTAQDALEAQENAAAALDQAAQTAGDASAADALSSAAAAVQAGDVSQAAQQLMNAASGQTSATAQAMALAGMVRNATASAGMQTTGGGQGQGGQSGQGSGGGNGVFQSQGKGNGGGAGLGSSNQDGGTGANSKPGNMQGNADPSKRTDEYETIYDPTRLGGSGEAVSESGEMGEGTISEAQIGTGLGTIDGSVPYGQALPEYERQAVEAVQNAALPDYARQWVTDYFRALE